MKEVVKFWGEFDNLVHIAGDAKGCGKYNVDPSDYPSGSWLLSDVHNDQRCQVHAFYNGTWCFAVAQDEVNKPLPFWDFRVHMSALQANGYTTILSMVVPEKTQIELL